MSEDNFSLKEFMAHSLNDMKSVTQELHDDIKEIKLGVKDVGDKVGIQNGRVTKLEEWSKNAQLVIQSATETVSQYKTDKAKIWVAISLLLFFGGTIITLAIMAIDNKIQDAVEKVFAQNVKEINYEQ